jgi:hypothetical protein
MTSAKREKSDDAEEMAGLLIHNHRKAIWPKLDAAVASGSPDI